MILSSDVMQYVCISLLLLTVSRTPTCRSSQTCAASFSLACYRSSTESVHLMSFQLRRHKLCGFSRAETPESPVQPAEEKYSFKETNCCVLLDLHKSLWECGGNKKSNKNSIRNSAAVLFVRPNNPGRSVNSFLQQM